MYVCMYVCMHKGRPLWLCPWKGTVSAGPRRKAFQRSPVFPTWLATNYWLPCSHLCSRALRWGWETMKRYPGTIPGPFAIGLSGNQTGDSHFTNRGNNQILTQKDPLQAVGVLLWLGARRHWWCRRRKYYICPTPLHQPPNFPPKLGYHTLVLQGTQPTHLARICYAG